MHIPGYEIQKQIGEGGMATAYLAIQKSLGRQVVLKVLNAARQKLGENVERFMNEARIVASLNHPNVVTIFDIGRTQDFIYMSMEYVEGGDLRSRLRNKLAPHEALDILVKIGGGLSAAHKKGIIHRDVKPGNVLFRKDGTPLLGDFGIAKRLTTDLDLTATGIFLGSPNYMAPEQADAGPIDGRADIYSLGIIFYEMLTGNKPYQSDSVVDIIIKHKHGPIPQLPPGLERYQPLLNLMLAKKRKDRFRDADSMLHYIRHLQQNGDASISNDVQRKPDINVSGRHGRTLDKARQFSINKTPSPRRTLYVLSGLLMCTVAAYGTLIYMGSRYDMEKSSTRPPDPALLQLQTLPREIDSLAGTLAHGSTDQADAATQVQDPTTSEVIRALIWLGNKSLEDYRLTHPPKDNAYYFYTRLLEIDPNNPIGRRGLLMIAERFAYLAERELAKKSYQQAQKYVDIGLRFDPANETLLTLRTLTESRGRGLLDNLLRVFSRSN
jgi:serine/threonine-protein kinase PpkA